MTRFGFVLLVVFSLGAPTTPAQSKNLKGEKVIVLSPLVAQKPALDPVERTADVLNIRIYKAIKTDDGDINKVGRPLNPAADHTFRSGDIITVSFTPSFESYVYFVNRGPEGTRVVFPIDASNIQSIPPDETHNVSFRFNNNVGREEFIVLVSRDRLSKLDDAIAQPDKVLDAQTNSPLESTKPAADNKKGGASGQPGNKGTSQPGKNNTKGKQPYRVFSGGGLLAANPRVSVMESPSAFASATVTSSSRGIEFLQEEGDPGIKVRPVRDEKGSFRFGAGQVGTFSISFDHR